MNSEKARKRISLLVLLALVLSVFSTASLAQQPEGGQLESVVCGDDITCYRSNAAVKIRNEGAGAAFFGKALAPGTGVKGQGKIGVWGFSFNGHGMWAESDNGVGLYATSDQGKALYAEGTSGSFGILHGVNTYDGDICPIYPLEPGSAGYFEMENSYCGYGVSGKGPIGVRGQSVSGVGVSGRATSNSGTTTGVLGVSESSVDGRGVFGRAQAASGNRYGVVGEVEGDGFGLFTLDDLYVGGSCNGCKMALVGHNAGADILRIGDVVAVRGVGPVLKGHTSPVLEVGHATSSDAFVLGVVYKRGEFYAASVDESGREAHDSVQPVAGDASPGDYLFIVTSGLAQARVVHAPAAPAPGQGLTVSDVAGVAMIAGADADPGLVFANAMQVEADENGLIWAMISTH